MITEPFILYIKKISLCTGSLKQSSIVIKEPPYLKQCFLNGRRNHYLFVCLVHFNPKPLTLFSLEIKTHISLKQPASVQCKFCLIFKELAQISPWQNLFPPPCPKRHLFSPTLGPPNLTSGWSNFSGEVGGPFHWSSTQVLQWKASCGYGKRDGLDHEPSCSRYF